MIQRFLSHIVSILFHPLILASYAFALILFTSPYFFASYTQEWKMMLLARTVLLTFFFPAFTILLMFLLNFISSIHMYELKDRILPFVSTGFFYIWAFFVFFKTNEVPPVLQAVLLGSAIAIFVALLFSLFSYKVSIHSSGAGGMIAMTLYLVQSSVFDMFWFFIASILLAGLVGTSRLILKAHSPEEVYGGYALGFTSTLIAIMILC